MLIKIGEKYKLKNTNKVFLLVDIKPPITVELVDLESGKKYYILYTTFLDLFEHVNSSK